MRNLVVLALAALLIAPTAARAAGTPLFEDLVKSAEADYASVKGTPYQEELTGELRVNMHLVFGHCTEPLTHSTPQKAEAVLELDGDGHVQAVRTPVTTPGSQCVEKELKKISFPKPPKSGFRFFFNMSR